jgi:hypothetical protein
MRIGSTLAMVALCIALAPLTAIAGEDEDRGACINDALTICSQFIPDRERVAECLISNNDRISEVCRTALRRFDQPVGSQTNVTTVNHPAAPQAKLTAVKHPGAPRTKLTTGKHPATPRAKRTAVKHPAASRAKSTAAIHCRACERTWSDTDRDPHTNS